MICTQCGAGMAGTGSVCDYCGTAYSRPVSRRDAASERGNKPDCPRCHQTLRATRLAHARVAHCTRCAGLWIPHDAMRDVLGLRKKDARQLHKLNRSRRKNQDRRRGARAGSIQSRIEPARCPTCHHAMRLESVARDDHTYLDVCDNHGTWFDKTELRAILDRKAANTWRRTGGERRKVVPRATKRRDWDAGSALFLLGAVIDALDDGFDFFD